MYIFCNEHSLNWQKILKMVVDELKKELPLPTCELAIKWKGEERDILPDVSRRVDLVGAKPPNDHFYIELPEHAVVPLQALRPLPVAKGQARIVLKISPDLCYIHVYLWFTDVIQW